MQSREAERDPADPPMLGKAEQAAVRDAIAAEYRRVYSSVVGTGDVGTSLTDRRIRTDQGEVVVRVQIYFHSPARLLLRFEVVDTGIGLAPEEIQKLFQPFVQVDTSSSRKYGGTGLGLAISRKLIELMGGRVGVQSKPGAGSTFWFELPFGVPPQPPIERSFPGLVFLQAVVAVPNASQRQALVEQLHGWGVVSRGVGEAGELARALQNDFRAAVIPLVICDEEMLAQGGDELGRLLAENKQRVQSILLASPVGSLGAAAA